MTRVRRTTVSVTILGTVALIASLVGASATTASATSTCSALFDDFSYTSPSDSRFTDNGWQARSNAGGPGVVGAGWSSNNITFPTVHGSTVARLTAYTNGTAGTRTSTGSTTPRTR